MKFNYEIGTDGDGYWSVKKKNVRLESLELAYINKDEDFGELRVYFDANTWNIQEDGLIYTDSLFLASLQGLLENRNLSSTDVLYSEQGMQGDDYVSLDVGRLFINSWKK